MAGAEKGSAPADVRIVTNDKYGDVKMTVQVCNPSYSLKWSADKKFEDDPRYKEIGEKKQAAIDKAKEFLKELRL